MIIENLGQDLAEQLPLTEEIWIASGLITKHGIHFINQYLPDNSTRSILVGIDMQTPVDVLELIQENAFQEKCNARIGKSQQGIFHPKLYLLRKSTGYIAFVGSANLTSSALQRNTELNILIHDQEQCNQLKDWFDRQYAEGHPLNDENIKIYKDYLASIPQQPEPDSALVELKTAKDYGPLNNINFSGRYFSRGHHWAFRRDLWRNKTPAANNERYAAHQRFLELHDVIYPRFKDFSLNTLFPNQKNHIVSMYYHHDNSQKNIDAMWLSYGKSPDEIAKYHSYFKYSGNKDQESDLQSFINHARLQIRIELESIGIWLLFGKNNGGSMFDRDNFKGNMRKFEYQYSFLLLLRALPEPYWISVNGIPKPVSSFINQHQLHEFCKQDDPLNYFIIGRDYKISDEEMSEANLPETTLNEFRRLMPLYKHMRHYLP